MIISFPNNNNLKVQEGDILALIRKDRNDKFIGYGEVIAVLSNITLVSVGEKISKMFNELNWEQISYSTEIINQI